MNAVICTVLVQDVRERDWREIKLPLDSSIIVPSRQASSRKWPESFKCQQVPRIRNAHSQRPSTGGSFCSSCKTSLVSLKFCHRDELRRYSPSLFHNASKISIHTLRCFHQDCRGCSNPDDIRGDCDHRLVTDCLLSGLGGMARLQACRGASGADCRQGKRYGQESAASIERVENVSD